VTGLLPPLAALADLLSLLESLFPVRPGPTPARAVQDARHVAIACTFFPVRRAADDARGAEVSHLGQA
jgi:hypothetical protein